MTTKALAPAVQGDTYSPQVITWEKQNLTGATVTAVKQNLSTRAVTAVTGTITVTSSTSEESVFSWAYSEADTGTAGRFVVQFRATYPGDASDATMRASWYVEPLLLATAVAAPLLVGVSSDEAAWLTTSEAGGALGTAAYAATGDFEAALGNPAANGDILSSTTAGVRSWVTPTAAPTLFYDTQLGFNEKPGDSAVDFVSIGRACTFKRSNPSSVTSGYAYALTGPAATATFELFLNSTKIEEIEWNTTDDKVGSFSGDIAATDVAIAAGDRLRLVAPASADADLADIRIVVRLEVA